MGFSIGRQSLNIVTGNIRCIRTSKRDLSSELTTALRPFYFAVHPDLFQQHPVQRQTNEDSLKQFSSHVESLYEHKFHNITNSKVLQFYMRDKNADTRDTFKIIKIQLNERDPKAFIQKVLETCNLSTEYVKKIKSQTFNSKSGDQNNNGNSSGLGFNPGQDYNYGSEFSSFESNFRQAKKEKNITIDTWIEANFQLAHERTKEVADLKAEVEKLQKSIVNRLGLRDVRYDCGWNIEHYRGCLKSFERLVDMHETQMRILFDRIVVFAPFTGVSLEGHIMLFTGDVLNNWLDFINNIPQHDSFLKKIPLYEQALSQVFLDIQIGRRKFMPKQQAREYASHLMKVTTTLGDYLSRRKFPKHWPKSLKAYKIVVESEAGPLMVSPTGQFIAPATCPGSILVDFITTNMEKADKLMMKYQADEHIERDLELQCIAHLQLKSLTKEDSVTPDKMIEALQHLLKCDSQYFRNVDLHITNYYSVLTDGIVCIPWDYMHR